jgi:hypothetical protein
MEGAEDPARDLPPDGHRAVGAVDLQRAKDPKHHAIRLLARGGQGLDENKGPRTGRNQHGEPAGQALTFTKRPAPS